MASQGASTSPIRGEILFQILSTSLEPHFGSQGRAPLHEGEWRSRKENRACEFLYCPAPSTEPLVDTTQGPTLRKYLNTGPTRSKPHSSFSSGDDYRYFTDEETEIQRDQEQNQDSQAGFLNVRLPGEGLSLTLAFPCSEPSTGDKPPS